MTEYTEVELNCMGCGVMFVWTPGEQKFLQSLVEDGKIPSAQTPKRCVNCRRVKKEQLARQAEQE